MNHTPPSELPKTIWRQASRGLVPTAVLACFGIYVCTSHGNLRTGDFSQKLIAAIGILIFLIGSTLFLQVLSSAIGKVLKPHLSTGRTAAIQFLIRLIGFVTIILMTLTLLEIPIEKLLLGGAALGVILSVAAQQSLANFFASIVLIISRPFQVGDELSITSGPLGGTYIGEVKDIGLSHTRIATDKGRIVMLPNATLLSGGAIIKETSHVPVHNHETHSKSDHSS